MTNPGPQLSSVITPATEPGLPESRRRRWLVAFGAVSTLLIAVLLAPSTVLNSRATGAAEDALDCAEVTGLEVSTSGWPVVPRAIGGSLPEVRVHADRLVGSGFRAHDVSAVAENVTFPAEMLVGGDGPVHARTLRATATLTSADLTATTRELTGAPVDVVVENNRMSIQAGLLGVAVMSVPVEVRVVGRDLVLRTGTPIPGLSLTSRITPPPEVRLESAEPVGDGLRIAVTVDPRTELSGLLCRSLTLSSR